MELSDIQTSLGGTKGGRELHDLMAVLYPICRSITGQGVRETLQYLQRQIPLEIREVASGTRVFDWTVPLEWNIHGAYLATIRGEKLLDFRANNLHVVSYSVPVKGRFTRDELEGHLHSLPDRPDWIPYRTSYYKENWGFCLTHRQLAELTEPEYDVCIDSSLQPGHLTYGEVFLPGQMSEEVLISCHVCHPSLCNDNLSGIAVATRLVQTLQHISRKYSYRFVFIPGTIGSITWLSQNRERAGLIRHGVVLTGVGDSGGVTYKRSRQGNAYIDRAMAHVLKHYGQSYRIIDFFPYGYDERQYCSPGFNLPVGCFMRSPHGEYPEYHTSADNLEFVTPEALQDSLAILLKAMYVIENDAVLVSTNPYCEPQLGRRGLYRAIAGQKEGALQEMALLWVLNMADGHHTLLDMAEHADTPFEAIHAAAQALKNCELVR
ncbi:MAG: Protein containing aminopeptidase domain [Nitrospira sp.]|jgi:aminopeptidase-like protein|nr:MAG: Protein containing aminopeptidase domain [Nitrospira sp.]